MDSDFIIRAEGLGKKYTIGHQSADRTSTMRDAIARSVGNFARTTRDILRGKPLIAGDEVEEFWALKDISFEIERGHVLGIIGRNGAGKSTLLKILSRITEPSEGRIELRGRVASLLEVGTGFHPELTGRENIYLNGAILGMTRGEIRQKFDEIIAFAEVDKFLDTPVKRYSSGMYVRLAFAIAAHLDPEILIVDEVLAVGDAEFQKKCLGKMRDVALGGRTVLFVSHNLRSIADLCMTAMLLEKGRVTAVGTPRDVVSGYISGGTENVSEWKPDGAPDAPFRSNRVSILNADTGKKDFDSISYTDAIMIEIDYTVAGKLPDSRLAIKLTNEDGQPVLCSSDTDHLDSALRPWFCGRTIVRCKIPGRLLMPGRYGLAISEPRASGGDWVHDDIATFTVNGLGSPSERDGRPGVVVPLLEWSAVGDKG